MQADGKVLIGGILGSVNGVSQDYLARLNEDGSLDTAFLSELSSNVWVSSLAVQTDGKVLVAGRFSLVNGVSRNNLARLNPDGSLDTTFLNGLSGVSGTTNNFEPAPVQSMVLQTDGKVLIAGNFKSVNGVSRNNIARLNSDGSLDAEFLDGLTGPNGWGYSISLQLDGNILIGGLFSSVNGLPASSVARLYGSGASYLPGLSIQRVGGQVTLLWPLESIGFSVQRTATLMPANWQPVLGTVQSNGSQFQITLPTTNQAQFFRLSKP